MKKKNKKVVYKSSNLWYNNYRKTSKKRGKHKLKTWWIEGYKLDRLIVDAETFDEAIAIARRVNKGYSGGSVIEIDGEPVENFYIRNGKEYNK